MWLKRKIMKALNAYYTSGGGFPVKTITGTKLKSELLTKDIAETYIYTVLYINKSYDNKRRQKLEQIIKQCKKEKYFNKHYQLNEKGQRLIKWHTFIPDVFDEIKLLSVYHLIVISLVGFFWFEIRKLAIIVYNWIF